MNTEAKSYLTKIPDKCLQEVVREKKNMYLEACLQKRRHFSHFVSSVDGLMEVEAEDTLKIIASRLTTKWQQPYSRTHRYIKSRIATTLVRAM